jgi:elongation factor 2
MVNFTIDQIRDMMDQKHNIRNISVIAHVDHGKSTLTDSLIGKAGIIATAREGEARFMDTRDDEQARSITIKSTSVSLYYERTEIETDEKGNENETKHPYLINLIDSPGHVDFSSEVTAALRVTDGALVVVDCIEGVCVQTETVLRQAISERIRPVLFLNKLDRIFLELSPSLEECYTNFRNSIESVNVICKTYEDEKLGNVEVIPHEGKVGFGSGLHAWGFTLLDFAKMYSSKFGLTEQKLMKKLWGENFWDPKEKQWVKKNDSGNLQRGFCQFVLAPIRLIFDSIMSEKKAVYEPIIAALKLKMTKDEITAAGTRPKDYLKLVMKKWIPAGDALLDMIAEHLPSPAVAQGYRVDNLYTGDLTSKEAEAVRTCDTSADAPMSMYVSKMVPTAEKGRFVAFGRVFSGTIKTGQEVRIMGPDYVPGGKKDLFIKKVQRTMLMMGRYTEQINDCPAGNVCGLVGIDQYLLKSGTLSSSENFLPFHTMKFSVAAVVQVAVEPKNAADLPKLVKV